MKCKNGSAYVGKLMKDRRSFLAAVRNAFIRFSVAVNNRVYRGFRATLRNEKRPRMKSGGRNEWF